MRLLSCFILLVMAAGCRTNEHVSTLERQGIYGRLDSIRETVTRDVEKISVPIEKAELVLSVDKLSALPLGALYENSSGRARVSVARQGGDLLVMAHCDSLELAFQNVTRELHHYRSTSHFENAREIETTRQLAREGPSSWQWFQIWGFRLLLLLISIYLLLKRLNFSKLWQRMFY